MDKDRNKLKSNTQSGRPGCSKCIKPDTCIHLRSLRQQQLEKVSSTKVLHKVKDFKENRSDEDIFFDCLSVGDSELISGGNSCKSSSGKSSNMKGSCPQTSDSRRFDDPEALRATLERIAQSTQLMLKNFEQANMGCRKSCNATLEITARLITDAKNPNPNCRFQGRPVTMKMPLEFDPCTGQLGTKSATSSRQICKQPCNMPCNNNSNAGKVYQSQASKSLPSEADTKELPFVGSCTETIDSSSQEVPLPVPAPTPKHVHSKHPSPGQPSPRLPSPRQATDTESDNMEEVEWKQEPLPESEDRMGEEESVHILEYVDSSEPLTPVLNGRYFMALPQHKDFSNCSPCRYSPSPIMDEDGNIFCPGNCGCCQCAWKRRSFDTNNAHSNVKVCRCVQRGTIFTNFDDRETCSQTSYFDFCPCREKAESKYLELYNCEMWSSPNATRGPEVHLDQIRELTVPPQPRS